MINLRVLVIDDSLTMRAMIEQIVEREPGSRVVGFASDVVAAKSLLDELLPNVITLDLSMPDGSGFEILDYLRDKVHAPVVVVSSTTKSGSAASAEALTRGAEAVFDKALIISNSIEFIRALKGVVRRNGAASRKRAGGGR